MVSKNTRPRLTNYIGRQLQVTHTPTRGQYLGLPSQTARNKCQVLNSMKDRVRQVSQGWKEKIFSVGGKEVLIKVVA